MLRVLMPDVPYFTAGRQLNGRKGGRMEMGWCGNRMEYDKNSSERCGGAGLDRGKWQGCDIVALVPSGGDHMRWTCMRTRHALRASRLPDVIVFASSMAMHLAYYDKIAVAHENMVLCLGRSVLRSDVIMPARRDDASRLCRSRLLRR